MVVKIIKAKKAIKTRLKKKGSSELVSDETKLCKIINIAVKTKKLNAPNAALDVFINIKRLYQLV